MYDQQNQPLYWLLFCTDNLRGLEEMKKAMWHVDRTGGFKFSDRDNPDQLQLLDVGFSQSWLADELREKLGGRHLNVQEIKEYVLTETPCYLFKSALQELETGRRVVSISQAPIGRRPGTYPDDKLGEIVVQFPKSLFAA
jgi:hypothetical protein